MIRLLPVRSRTLQAKQVSLFDDSCGSYFNTEEGSVSQVIEIKGDGDRVLEFCRTPSNAIAPETTDTTGNLASNDLPCNSNYAGSMKRKLSHGEDVSVPRRSDRLAKRAKT